MKKTSMVVVASLFVAMVALPVLVNAESNRPSKEVSGTVKMTATVESLDTANRTVTLKGPQGNFRTIKCGPEVKNYDQIKVGDKVHVEYTESLALSVRKSTEPATASATSTMTTAAKGDKPAMTATSTKEVTAKVEAIDQKTRMVTLRGPEGNAYTFKVSDDVKRLNEINKGDEVVAVYTEGLAIHVTSPGTEKAKK